MQRNLLATLLFLTLATAAGADTLKVPGDFGTIQEAVDAAQTGDQIQVSKGTHDPFVVDGKTGITIKGKGKPVVDATGMATAAATVQNSSGIILDGLVLRSPDAVPEAEGARIVSSTDVTLRKCTIEDVGSDGIRTFDSSGLLIEKCTIQRTAQDGIQTDEEDVLLLPATTASTFRKNKFIDIGDDGIDLEGNDHLVEKNGFEDMDSHAIIVEDDASRNTVVKNKVDDTGGDAIKVEGDDNVVEKNKIKNAEKGVNVEGDDNLVIANKITGGISDGIRARGTRNRYEKNKIKGHGDGFDVEATDSEFVANKISSCGEDGIEIGSSSNPTTGNLLEGNKVSKCDRHGIFVTVASGNTFRNNKAKKNGGFDLLDENAPGINTYESNSFGTESIGP